MPLRRLLILTLGCFVIGTELFIIGGILPDIADSLKISVSLAGQLVTVFACAYAVGAPFLTTMLWKLSRRSILFYAMIAFAISNFATALAPNFSSLLVIRIVSALSASLFIPNAASMVAELSETQRRGRNLGIVMSGLGVATVLGVPLGITINALLSWRWVFVFVAVLSLAQAFLILSLPKNGISPVCSLKTRFSSLKNPAVVKTLVVTVLVICAGFTTYTYIAIIVQKSSGMNNAVFAFCLSMYGLASILGSWAGGWFSDRYGPQKALILNMILLVLVFALLSPASSQAIPAILVMFLWGIVGSAFTPIQQHRLLQVAGANGSAALALNSSAIYLGQMFAGCLGGIVLAWSSASIIPIVSSCIDLAVLVFVIIIGQKASRAKFYKLSA